MINKFLCIDIGNSRLSVGLFHEHKLIERNDFRIQQLELAIVFLVNKIKLIKQVRVIVSSVIPDLAKKLIDALSNLNVKIIELKSNEQNIITNIYDGIGIDRIANATAAIKLYSDKEVIGIIDFGSATTLTVVENSGKFLGGLITLGISKTFKAISNYLDQLPEVDLDGLKIASPLAFDTDKAIANGCFLSHIGTVDCWINTVKTHVNKDVYIIGTGGFIQVLAGFCSGINLAVTDLTLTGVNYLGQAQSPIVKF